MTGEKNVHLFKETFLMSAVDGITALRAKYETSESTVPIDYLSS